MDSQLRIHRIHQVLDSRVADIIIALCSSLVEKHALSDWFSRKQLEKTRHVANERESQRRRLALVRLDHRQRFEAPHARPAISGTCGATREMQNQTTIEKVEGNSINSEFWHTNAILILGVWLQSRHHSRVNRAEPASIGVRCDRASCRLANQHDCELTDSELGQASAPDRALSCRTVQWSKQTVSAWST